MCRVRLSVSLHAKYIALYMGNWGFTATPISGVMTLLITGRGPFPADPDSFAENAFMKPFEKSRPRMLK